MKRYRPGIWYGKPEMYLDPDGEWIDMPIRVILLDKDGRPECVVGASGLQYDEFELEVGGKFNYLQYDIEGAADIIESILTESLEFSYLTSLRLEQTARALRGASIMLNRVDWLLSGDDGEDTFNERWVKDLQGVKGVE